MRCPNCGAPVPSGGDTCLDCGKRLILGNSPKDSWKLRRHCTDQASHAAHNTPGRSPEITFSGESPHSGQAATDGVGGRPARASNSWDQVLPQKFAPGKTSLKSKLSVLVLVILAMAIILAEMFHSADDFGGLPSSASEPEEVGTSYTETEYDSDSGTTISRYDVSHFLYCQEFYNLDNVLYQECYYYEDGSSDTYCYDETSGFLCSATYEYAMDSADGISGYYGYEEFLYDPYTEVMTHSYGYFPDQYSYEGFYDEQGRPTSYIQYDEQGDLLYSETYEYYVNNSYRFRHFDADGQLEYSHLIDADGNILESEGVQG